MLGRVSFQAGGRELACAFTTSAMCAYEEQFDEPFFALVEKFEDTSKMRLTLLVRLFKIAVRACNCEMTDDDLSALADEVGPAAIVELVIEAFTAAFPEGDGKAKKSKPGQKGQSKK